MKTTLEIPDSVFRRAKAQAAQRGIPLRQFVTEAVAEKLALTGRTSEKPWMEAFGGLRHLHEDHLKIQRLIDQEFENIEPEEIWIDPRYERPLGDC